MKFRIQTVSYQENVDPEVYGTDDPTEAALNAQEELRNTEEPLIVINDVIGSKAEVFVSVFDPGGMMFNDEAIREFIQILRISKLHYDIDHKATIDKRVTVLLEGDDTDGNSYEYFATGRAMGEALRTIREQLRIDFGR
jgi:hypothetical protein